MRRLAVVAACIFVLVLGAWPITAGRTGSARADGFAASECPAGKVLFAEEPILKTDGYKNLMASVLIRSKALSSETHLHQRSDGWTHLSSEKTVVGPREVISNCLPAGEYEVRIEYYTRVTLVGDWLLGVGEYRLLLDRPVLPEDLARIPMRYQRASVKDNILLNWPLFAAYALVPAFFALALIAFLYSLKNKPRRGKENGA